MEYHIWLGNESGYVWAMGKNYNLPKTGERFKYMGISTDMGWPKKLSTGRLLYKQNSKTYKKQKIKRKRRLSNVQKTDTKSNSSNLNLSVPTTVNRGSSNGESIKIIGYGSG